MTAVAAFELSGQRGTVLSTEANTLQSSLSIHQAKRAADMSQTFLCSDALPLLLQQHSFLLDAAAICQLACTSKALRTAVLQHCKGQLTVHLVFKGPQHVVSFLAWLASCGCLLGVLELQPHSCLDEFTECIAMARYMIMTTQKSV